MRPGMGKGIPATPGIALPGNIALALSAGAAAVADVAAEAAGGTR
jgi:2-keto-3-deoxy-6-phosphogluconate aldolase